MTWQLKLNLQVAGHAGISSFSILSLASFRLSFGISKAHVLCCPKRLSFSAYLNSSFSVCDAPSFSFPEKHF